ncbi:hypothetical protein CIG75_07400 [Tumebacillus algifaecis]|uniref:DUF72 domain-containing protein n=1 Tax=Tumebacillus algifaecis TaxID=1214604 RepID=A0A223CZM6_9BACL|nr:DUF72 domain-containing protein [Tumebacillus algifaecis]ASS74820.1 hypothetical protein CIG75_07400 [Tumebacillus algifaecis]
MRQVLCGTCAWGDHEDFYPKKVKPNERLEYYAKYFPLVEVDSSFYAIPNPKYVERWAATTGSAFTFNMKAYKGMTGHERTLDPKQRQELFPLYRHAIQPMVEAGKLGALLFQLPPWYVLNRENVDYLRRCRDFFHDLTVAVEFRHRSWFDGEMREKTLQFLRREEIVNTIVDEPQVGDASIPAVVEVTESSLALVRFHGRNEETWYIKDAKHAGERFRYHYRKEELAEWVPQVAELKGKAQRVHLLMNNNFSNYAVQNAFDMMELLGQEVERAPLSTDQLDLFSSAEDFS